MIAQAMAHNRRDNRHDVHGATGQLGPQPGSPTLTNPDMILPDYEDPLTDSENVQLPQSLWNSGHSIADGFQFDQNDFYANPDPFSTPIIYGNGTMLSDIGEVTEVESNVGGPSRGTSRRSRLSFDDGAMHSSLLAGNKFVQKRQQAARERRLSTDSTSTINTHDGGAFVDFDDAISVGGDSNFQGDDEESVASSYVDDSQFSQRMRPIRKSVANRLSDDAASTVSISKRAEEILANAKLRLTHMEDNLTRARTLSYSSMSDGSTPSPTGTRATSALRSSVKTPTQTSHSRNMSENGVAATSAISGYPQRSASALGAAGGYRRPLPTSRSMDALDGGSGRGAYTSHHHYPDTGLEPLGEDDDMLESEMNGNGSGGHNVASPTFGTFSDAGMPRASSVSQMRDIQDQMKGLKGKISSLREQARADSMKRRSLQSLRTQSPFTNAAWDPAQPESRSLYHPSEGPLASIAQPNDDIDASTQGAELESEEYLAEIDEDDDDKTENGEIQARKHQDIPQEVEEEEALPTLEEGEDVGAEVKSEAYDDYLDAPEEEANNDDTEELDTNDDTASEDYESEGGDSMYHDTIQQSVSHEDRADAFDYEHFFLHSAMGGARLRSESVASGESVETTRGPEVSHHQRRGSGDTTTSVDTFETATEGLASRSSTAQSAYRVYTPADLFEDTRKRHAISFRESGSGSDGTTSSLDNKRRTNSAMHRPLSRTSISTMHRPSYSSFESTGTNRSFPLVNKTKITGGILTPGGSPDHGLKQVTESLMSETSSIYAPDNNDRGGASPAIQALSDEAQASVKALMASLGKCVLALSETNGADDGGREMLRRKIEAARRILDGEIELP